MVPLPRHPYPTTVSFLTTPLTITAPASPAFLTIAAHYLNSLNPMTLPYCLFETFKVLFRPCLSKAETITLFSFLIQKFIQI